MTDGNLDMGRASDGDPMPVVSDVESCLVIVVSHIGSAPLVESVTTEAARRLMMSPMLADFIELRYTHLGPQPGLGGDLAAVVARITDRLIQPRPGVGRSFFAVVIMDRSAAATEAVLRECAASPFLAALPIRLHGIASHEDRHTPRPPKGVEILLSPVGAWRRAELIDELRRHANSLFQEFAAGQHPGVTPEQLARHGKRFADHLARERAVEAQTAAPVGGFAAIPDAPGAGSPPAQDALDPGAFDRSALATPPRPRLGQSGTPYAATGSGTASTGGADQATIQPHTALVARHQWDTAAAPGIGVPDHPGRLGTPEFLAGDSPVPGDGPATRPGRLASLSRRWMAEVRWRRADAADAGQAPRLPAVEQGLAYLLITGDGSGDPAVWDLSRSALLGIDKRLAAIPGRSMQVRALQGDEEQLHGDLRPAGELTRREVRGSVADLYFAGILTEIRRLLGRDQGRLAVSALPVARPAVVLFSPVPPFADSEAVESFRWLAQEASVIWVIPRSESRLLSEDFSEVSQVMTDFATIADDVAALFPAPSLPVDKDADSGVDLTGTDGDSSED